MSPSRRAFLTAAAAPIAALACARRVRAPNGSVVLFQGDSITDGGRNRTAMQPNVLEGFGSSYAAILMREIRADRPDVPWQFYNRGVSGDKIPDLETRWQTDTLALRPDILSVLVGVNDFWHRRTHSYTGTVADYEQGYRALLARTRDALPNVTLVVLEPFVLRVGAVDATWFPEFDERRAAAARVASSVDARFVTLQNVFNERAAQTGPAAWAADGVHPTPAGHALIAQRWRAVVGL